MTDNAVHRKTVAGLEAPGVTWRRVTDAEDRALRKVVTGVGGSINGPMREGGFDISAASEIMAILALASSYEDLRQRLGDVVVGWTKDGQPVTAREVGGVGALMALLRDAMKPNLAQTLEGQPAIIHMGPVRQHRPRLQFNPSGPLGGQLRRHHGDGSRLRCPSWLREVHGHQGAPRRSGAGDGRWWWPRCGVCAGTAGVAREDLESPNVDAVQVGAQNLANAIRIVKMYGLPVVVAINRFPTDNRAEVEVAAAAAHDAGAAVAEAARVSPRAVPA